MSSYDPAPESSSTPDTSKAPDPLKTGPASQPRPRHASGPSSGGSWSSRWPP